ncbi:MAG: hypothetical protein JNL60_08755, partial [Bacteroidia bacterium]|nr:hypothetical protein [Bacteroidia bacterium]
KKDTLAKCDQLIRYIQETKTNLKLIDVREELLAEKKKTQVYKKYDSHWNSYGAFIGYTALMNEMRKDIPSLKPLQLSDFNITWEDEGAGDLSILLGLNLKENSPVFKLKNDSSLSITLPTDGFPANTYIVQNDHASTQLTALIYRDSFSWALIPFLQHHFKKMVLLSNAVYSAEMVKKVKPDVVIECYATRYFR